VLRWGGLGVLCGLVLVVAAVLGGYCGRIGDGCGGLRIVARGVSRGAGFWDDLGVEVVDEVGHRRDVRAAARSAFGAYRFGQVQHVAAQFAVAVLDQYVGVVADVGQQGGHA
jgi:hypothetical protein